MANCGASLSCIRAASPVAGRILRGHQKTYGVVFRVDEARGSSRKGRQQPEATIDQIGGKEHQDLELGDPFSFKAFASYGVWSSRGSAAHWSAIDAGFLRGRRAVNNGQLHTQGLRGGRSPQAV